MKLLSRLRAFFRRDKFDAEMTEEMRHHIELQAALNVKTGMDPDEARYAAQRQFGNVAIIQEQAREVRGWVWLEQFIQDLRNGIGTLWRNPGFALLIILTLALAIGVNLSVISLGSSVLFRPLPGLRDAGRLVMIGRQLQGSGLADSSYPDFANCRDAATSFSQLAAYRETPFSLSADRRTERVMGEFVSGNYFRTLGVTMAAGRDFLPEEDAVSGRNAVAIISHRLWQQRWQGDPGVVGREVMIDGLAFTIVGVAEAGFRAVQLPTAHDLWVPLHMRALFQATPSDPFTDWKNRWLARFVGRLAAGQSLALAETELAAIATRSSPTIATTQDRPWSYRVTPYSPFPSADLSAPRIFLGLLIAITLLVLAAVSANVTSLFISRALARRREVAVRLALGASRGRVIRQFLSEGLIITAAAGGLGLMAANLSGDWLVRQIPGENGEPAALPLTLDWRLVLAGLGLVLASTLAIGLLPAWQASRVDLLTALKTGEGGQSGRRSRLRSCLVVAQIAVCMVLLVGSGLMYRSQRVLDMTAPAAKSASLLLARLDPALSVFDASRGQALYRALLDRVRSLPGVQSASLAVIPPFFDGSISLGDVRTSPAETAPVQPANVNFVSSDYFASLGMGLLRGRDFRRADGLNAPPVAIINRSLARSLWPNGDVLGRMVHFTDSGEPPRLVIGVVSDDELLRTQRIPDESRPLCYVPLAQRPLMAASLLVRTSGEPAALFPLVRAALRELNPNIPLFQIGTLESARDRSLWQQRVIGRMVMGCSAAAMLLALLGLYAAVSQDVARRTREIGIRVAVGADLGDVLNLVLRQGMKLAAAGLILGIVTAFAVTRLLRSVLIGVTPTDPLTFALALLGLAILAAAACWLPARRAAKVDPVIALRAE